jgi:hypothetical protein
MDTFYRTAKGQKRHQSFQCANQRRSIHTGNPQVIEVAEVKNWAPCSHCCPADLVERETREAATRAQAAQDDRCKNEGVRHPQRIQSECRSCGKRGTVDRRNGRLRAHRPQGR